MVDIEIVDKLFEAGRESGLPMQFRIFDRKVLLPLEQLPQAVTAESGEKISVQEIREKALAGWFPLRNGAGWEGGEEGAPLYVPSRIGLLLRLEKEGYGADELRLIAETEEWTIENILTTEDLAYVDDDLESLILFAQSRVDAMEHSWDGDGRPAHTTPDDGQAKRELEFLKRLQVQGIPARLTLKIEKQAFRVRAFNDVLRIHLLDMDRNKISAGYSPFTMCRSQSWRSAEGFKVEGLLWESTVRGALAYGSVSEPPPIRVPGFVLRGSRVTPTRTLRPAEYGNLWREHDLDCYLESWAKVCGERQCLNCFGPLPEEADERKRFCGEKCRNAAKQRRYRERNPEAVEQTQMRYWKSLDF